ncbi:hypothetical protein B0H14DRAFT_2722607 [Mycena olivaceomarginata]|nr:hypothetical protein B0H14DRAFT_2722607 [Mycena olivaceomarginata]
MLARLAGHPFVGIILFLVLSTFPSSFGPSFLSYGSRVKKFHNKKSRYLFPIIIHNCEYPPRYAMATPSKSIYVKGLPARRSAGRQ